MGDARWWDSETREPRSAAAEQRGAAPQLEKLWESESPTGRLFPVEEENWSPVRWCWWGTQRQGSQEGSRKVMKALVAPGL